MITSLIGRRGQLTIPRDIRRQLGLQEGDRVAFISQGDQVLLVPLRQSLLDLRGSVLVQGEQDFDAVRKASLAAGARKVAEHD